ncbi:hypothetical protein K438DRAFT_594561 [Mycena galopus ATCC 62051]|nr:hypothetical protein K438DRAFT_594561 [Mycena galopus ATCC 62051]
MFLVRVSLSFPLPLYFCPPLPRLAAFRAHLRRRMADGLVSIGLVVSFDYKNPYLEPYWEIQRTKRYPHFHAFLAGGTRLAYGTRALTECGLQFLARLDFPGGALVGCAAGVVNTAKIKGTHNAIPTGMLAAEAAIAALHPAAWLVSTASPGSLIPTVELDRRKIPSTAAEKVEEVSTPFRVDFPRSPAHADLWAVRSVCSAVKTR